MQRLLRSLGLLNVSTISKYVALAVYISAAVLRIKPNNSRAHRTASKALALLYGPAWTVAICGLAINNVFYSAMEKRDGTTPVGRLVGDVFAHIVPVALATLYAPATFPMSKMAYTAIVLALLVLLGPWLCDVYIGVPHWLIWAAAPAVLLGATYARY